MNESLNRYASLDGKVVVVTGAAGGIGRSIAERFAGQDAKVVVNDIDADAAAGVVASITDAGGTAISVVADVSDGDSVAAMFDTVMAEFGTVDVLVNNAGLVSPMLHFFEADEAWWRKIIDVNLTGHFLCSHTAARIMAKAGGGNIINMSSGGATRAHRAFTAYDATQGRHRGAHACDGTRPGPVQHPGQCADARLDRHEWARPRRPEATWRERAARADR